MQDLVGLLCVKLYSKWPRFNPSSTGYSAVQAIPNKQFHVLGYSRPPKYLHHCFLALRDPSVPCRTTVRHYADPQLKVCVLLGHHELTNVCQRQPFGASFSLRLHAILLLEFRQLLHAGPFESRAKLGRIWQGHDSHSAHCSIQDAPPG
jgi:hypothetical protein